MCEYVMLEEIVNESCITYRAAKALDMPLSTHSLHNRVRHWLLAFSTLARVPLVVAWQAPSVFILFDETGLGAEGL